MAVNVVAPTCSPRSSTAPSGWSTSPAACTAADGETSLTGMDWSSQRATGSYSDSKLLVTLAMAVARRWPEVFSNAVDPGWVPTKMGGPGAPDDLRLGHLTQVWLATSDDRQARASGGYWYHQRRAEPAPRSMTSRSKTNCSRS